MATEKERLKVLVVDDQAGTRLTLKAILTKKDYDVSVAESGEEALSLVEKNQFRLIFMDIKMPGMSGVETFLKIKKTNPTVAVIMMTAYALEEEIQLAIREGAFTVLPKPFNMEKMLDTVKECIEDRILVLVVDDQFEDRALLEKILEGNRFKVVSVKSGEECIKQVQDKKYKVILLDIVLDGMDGIETLDKIKKIRPDTAVIAITGFSHQELLENAMKKGSYACLQKPIDIDKLVETVDNSLKSIKK